MAVKAAPKNYDDYDDESFLHTPRGRDSQYGKSLLHGLQTGGTRGRFSNPNYVKALYSGKSEAMVKVISYTRGHRVKATLDYIARIDTEKKPNVECEDELSVEFKGEKGVLAIYDRWKQDFEKYPKRGLIRQKRDAAHIMFSSDCEHTEENAKKVLAAARETMARELGDKGYEYVSALHRDSDNLHVHFVVKCKNRYQGQPKLRLNPKELLQIRTQFANRLTELGLDHVATLRKDRPDIHVMVNMGIEQLQKNERQFQRAMRRAAPTRNAFLYRKKAALTIVRLRDQVKKQTAPGSKERRDLLTSLRTIERKLTKNRPGIEKEMAASFREYSQDFKKLNEFIAQAQNLPKDKVEEKKQLNKLIERNQTFMKTNLALARKNINESEQIPARAKKEALSLLDQYEKDIKKSMKTGVFTYKETLVNAGTSHRDKNALTFGVSFGMADKFEPLNKTVKAGIDTATMTPQGAVERLQKTRQLEKFMTEIRNQVNTAQKTIKKMETMDPALKIVALSDLRTFEKNVFDRLHGRGQAQKKRVVPQSELEKMKTLYVELKKQQPQGEKEQKLHKQRLFQLEKAMKKQILSQKKNPHGQQMARGKGRTTATIQQPTRNLTR